jgi:hypothetical protein
LSTVDLTADGTTDAARARGTPSFLGRCAAVTENNKRNSRPVVEPGTAAKGKSLASQSPPTRQRGEEIGNDNMKITLIVAVWTAAATTTISLAATTHADYSYSMFSSPSGNIACSIGQGATGKAGVACDIRQYTYPPPRQCSTERVHLVGDRFALDQGDPPHLECHSDTQVMPGLPTLDYGAAGSVGPIICDSERSGVTCTDTSTGHFFRVARDSYELG